MVIIKHILSIRFPFRFLFLDSLSSKHSLSDNGFVFDPICPGTLRNQYKLSLALLKFSLIIIVILALAGSFWWTIFISSSSRGHISCGYRRLQEQLVSELHEISELSQGSSRLRELEYFSQESKNFVPRFNVSKNLASGFSEGEEYNRQCAHGSNQHCLVLPPMNYKTLLRWPGGRDVIWFANVNIQHVRCSPQEFDQEVNGEASFSSQIKT